MLRFLLGNQRVRRTAMMGVVAAAMLAWGELDPRNSTPVLPEDGSPTTVRLHPRHALFWRLRATPPDPALPCLTLDPASNSEAWHAPQFRWTAAPCLGDVPAGELLWGPLLAGTVATLANGSWIEAVPVDAAVVGAAVADPQPTAALAPTDDDWENLRGSHFAPIVLTQPSWVRLRATTRGNCNWCECPASLHVATTAPSGRLHAWAVAAPNLEEPRGEMCARIPIALAEGLFGPLPPGTYWLQVEDLAQVSVQPVRGAPAPP